jgi:Protein of unknown function (DUF3455)
MSTSRSLPLRRLACLGAAGLALAACSTSPPVVAPAKPLPDALKPDGRDRAWLSHHARGVQIYRCEAAEGSFRWIFVAPEAQLFASAQSTAAVGTHGAGPFWQSQDGSKLVGKVKSRADAPAGSAPGQAIPWLLLTTTSAGSTGALDTTTHIQRINTTGGVAPSQGCATAADVGQQSRVPYTADYVYFKAP